MCLLLRKYLADILDVMTCVNVEEQREVPCQFLLYCKLKADITPRIQPSSEIHKHKSAI